MTDRISAAQLADWKWRAEDNDRGVMNRHVVVALIEELGVARGEAEAATRALRERDEILMARSEMTIREQLAEVLSGDGCGCVMAGEPCDGCLDRADVALVAVGRATLDRGVRGTETASEKAALAAGSTSVDQLRAALVEVLKFWAPEYRAGPNHPVTRARALVGSENRKADE